MMNAEEIIRFIGEAKKKTPVKVYVKEKEALDYGNAKVFGAGDKIVFGDWNELKPILEENADKIEDYVIENDSRNSAVPLLDKKNIEARIEPGAIIRDQVEIGKNAVIMMGAVINIGAVVGEGTMIDMGAILGGRATVGKHSHIGAGAVLAGVVEPASATPVIVEDDVLVGANAVIIEGVGANMGVVLPEEGFLEELRALCTAKGAVLILDEVITGFRLAYGGAQEYLGIDADLVTYGKIIGAGMPVGAYGGKKEIMEMVAPVGPVYQAGTLSGNPIAMAAGLTQLKILHEDKSIYTHIEAMANKLYEGMESIVSKYGKEYRVNHIQSLGCLYFADRDIHNYDDAKSSDTAQYADYFKHMINNGIHLGPSQFEAMFLSNAHKEEDINKTLEIGRAHV